MVITRMSTPTGSHSEAGVVVTHPNRAKPVVQATRATVIFLLLVSAALVLVITVGGAKVLEGSGPIVIQVLFIVLYLVLAFYASRWNRGVLPVAAALGILLATFALVAAPVVVQPRQNRVHAASHQRRAARAADAAPASRPDPVVAFAMRGFSQGWNVEREQRVRAVGLWRLRRREPVSGIKDAGRSRPARLYIGWAVPRAAVAER